VSSVFTKIMNGELPGRFIWQDDRCAAFLDISPLTYGHTLVVPREEIDMWTDVPEDLNNHLYTVASRIGAAQVTGLGAVRSGLIIQGYEIPHMHMHVFPTQSVADFDMTNIIREPEDDKMEDAAKKLRAALRDAGYGEFVPAD
jgi:histidine triad (HIT) family protein